MNHTISTCTQPGHGDIIIIVVDKFKLGGYSFGTHREVHSILTHERHVNDESIAFLVVLVVVGAGIGRTFARLVGGGVYEVEVERINLCPLINGEVLEIFLPVVVRRYE